MDIACFISISSHIVFVNNGKSGDMFNVPKNGIYSQRDGTYVKKHDPSIYSRLNGIYSQRDDISSW